ncbi:MAG: ATP-dependent zinc protease [Planctomycetes bacterium]|nr:ATP-dependent zinc protease [Planctomycetota bacterium]
MAAHLDSPDLPLIGWREWIALPELGVPRIKAKADTGARSSSLHAWDIEEFQHGGETWVRFVLHPLQRSTKESIRAEAKLLERRPVRSSTGHQSLRPVIVTQVALLGQIWPIELTLAGRDEMGFRMLLGREALRGRFLVHPGASYFGGKPARRRKKRRRR